jgi:hypothetical protein
MRSGGHLLPGYRDATTEAWTIKNQLQLAQPVDSQGGPVTSTVNRVNDPFRSTWRRRITHRMECSCPPEQPG